MGKTLHPDRRLHRIRGKHGLGDANANADPKVVPVMAPSRVSTTHLQQYSDLATLRSFTTCHREF
jgi:hypothetical protein